jgi:26S proteasome regulatory subunit N11
LGGTTLTPVSVAGYPASTSTLNKWVWRSKSILLPLYPTRFSFRRLSALRTNADTTPAQSFEQLNPRCVAVVVDPIQSVRGKVVIDAFRSINPQSLVQGQESRQTTSNIGHLNKPSIQALIHGLNRHYYSESISPFSVSVRLSSVR